MVSFFANRRAARRDDSELGRGVWRRAHDRFRRGLDRYHQVIEDIDDVEMSNSLVLIGNDLARLAPRVRAVCIEAQRIGPSEGSDIPASDGGYLNDVHRALTRGGNALAAVAEAAAMARWQLSEDSQLRSVHQRAASVAELVGAAEAALQSR